MTRFAIGCDRKERGALKQNCGSIVVKLEVVSLCLKNGPNGMCDRCVELDSKIEHYQRLRSGITDQATLDGIRELIERMEAQKAALHSDQTQ